MMDTTVLEAVGLTRSEIKVYLALLEIGSSSTGPIVEKAGVSSSKIYEILEKLMQKGLASVVITAGTKHFEAADPSRIMDYLRDKELAFSKQKHQLELILPELQLKRAPKQESETTVFKGVKGAITAFRDMLSLKKADEITCMGHTDLEPWFQKFLTRFHKKRSAQGINMRLLYGPRLRKLAGVTAEMGHTTIKQYPQGYENPAAIFTYCDTTLFSLPYDKLWIQIRNKRLAQAHNHQFETFWNQEVRMLRGKEGVQTLAEESVRIASKHYSREIRCIGVQAGLSRYSMELYKLWESQCEVNKIKWKYLCDPEAKKYVHRFTRQDASMMQLKYLTNEISSPTVIWLYGNIVATVVWKKEPFVTFIENKEIAAHYRKYFDYLWGQETMTLRGFEGIKEMCDKVIETKEDLYLIGANAKIMNHYPPFFNEFEKKRIQNSIKRHILAVQEIKSSPFVKLPLSEVRFLPPHLSSPMVIWIFGDFVAQTIWTKPEVVFIVENRQAADDYRGYFKLLWKSSTA